MNLSSLQSETAVGSEQPDALDTRLRGRWLVLARIGWVVLVTPTVVLFLAGIPVYYDHVQTLSTSAIADPNGIRIALAHLGFSTGSYTALIFSFLICIALVWFAVGVVIFWRRSDNWVALLASFFFAIFGLIGNIQNLSSSSGSILAVLALAYPALQWWILGVDFLAIQTFFSFCTLFPDGRFVPHWIRFLPIALLVYAGARTFLPEDSPFNPARVPLLVIPVYICLVGILVVAQIYRYMQVSNTVQRQQTKWIVYGMSLFFVGEVGLYTPSLIFPSSIWHGSLYELILFPGDGLISLLLPLSFGSAILRYRLWDIDIIINRTLVYGTLTISSIGIYILIVGSLSTLFQSSGNLVISLVATGLVAVLFQPLRERFQRAVNRFIYGECVDPYAVLSRLGKRLEATLAPDAVLAAIVVTIARVLKLPYAAIILKQGDEYTTVASYGASRGELVHLPLTYQTEPVGELLLAPRIAGEHFTPADRRLLDDLARQAGVATHTVRLTADLQQLAGELQASRTQLVTAREEERRRLRRDLHDGLGSSLTSVTFQLDAAYNLLDRDLNSARTLLKDLKAEVQASIADIRRLVYNLRPPILDEWGLAAALREQVAQYQLNSVHVIVDAPESLPALPAAVEVVAYRIALEALANVIRHAQATTCTMRLVLVDNALILKVQDDGKGLPADYHAGVGICAMRERAAELGGSCIVDSSAGAGTCVYACLPVPKE